MGGTIQRIAIGVDQSYSRSGISIAVDGKLVSVSSINYEGCKTKSEKRKALANHMAKVIAKCAQRAPQTIILVERIRTFSSNGQGSSTLSMSYIKATAALIATIVDVASEYGIKVYSVDTRAWKTQILGSNGKVQGDPKAKAIAYVEKLGFCLDVYGKKGQILKGKNDDAADSACIALYAFLPKSRRKLLREE